MYLMHVSFTIKTAGMSDDAYSKKLCAPAHMSSQAVPKSTATQVQANCQGHKHDMATTKEHHCSDTGHAVSK